MRTVPAIMASVFLLASQAAAQSSPPLRFDQPANAKPLAVKSPKAGASCAAYGAGFVKLAGTDTCVKVGGAVSVDAGTNVGRH